jgi:glutathione synthase/RimK-type ligase-like ATP-grasp enzyme
MEKKTIYILVDYKGYFGSKFNSIPYRSGFDKSLLCTLFLKISYEVIYLPFSQINENINLKNETVLYQSSEDIGYHYKSFIEDIVYSLELSGARIIPSYKYLKANNNKVFMELIRKNLGHEWNDSIDSKVFGSVEELYPFLSKLNFPVVIKTAEGAMSTGVFLAKNQKDLVKISKGISKSGYFFEDIKDFLRAIKHKGYIRESSNRNKFIIQQFIPNLKNDWKVLVYGDRYYILKRSIKENDFRASGSKYNYGFGSKSESPEGIFDFCKKIFIALDVPNASFDIAFDGKLFYLIEFQTVLFGPATQLKSDCYFECINGNWISFPNIYNIEEINVYSIDWFLKRKQ